MNEFNPTEEQESNLLELAESLVTKTKETVTQEGK